MFLIHPIRWLTFLCMFVGVCATSAAWAQSSLGSFTGDTVIYDGVTENSSGLFGVPSISGDTLDFSSGLSLSFEADSVGGSPATTGGLISTEIAAQPGAELTQLDIEAGGFLQLFRFAGALTSDTAVSATISIEVELLEVAGASLPTPISLLPSSKVFAEANLADDGPLVSPVTWNDLLTYDLAVAAADQGITQPITRVRVEIDTVLEAQSESTTRSLIALRAFDTLTLTVPEPSSIALLLTVGPLFLRTRAR